MRKEIEFDLHFRFISFRYRIHAFKKAWPIYLIKIYTDLVAFECQEISILKDFASQKIEIDSEPI